MAQVSQLRSLPALWQAETWFQQITRKRREKGLKTFSTSLLTSLTGKSKSEVNLHFDELNVKMCLMFVTFSFHSAYSVFCRECLQNWWKKYGVKWKCTLKRHPKHGNVLHAYPCDYNWQISSRNRSALFIIGLNLVITWTSIKFQYIPHTLQSTVSLKSVHFWMCTFFLYFVCV